MVWVPELRAAGDVTLNPGGLHFHCPMPDRAQPARLRTLLGSCVSVVLWHPERRIGGMSHIILPCRKERSDAEPPDPRYADEAIAMFYRNLIRAGTMPQQYQVYVVGGSQMYVIEQPTYSVGTRNVEATRIQLQQAGFRVHAEHVGTQYHRKVDLDLGTGEVTVTWNHQRTQL